MFEDKGVLRLKCLRIFYLLKQLYDQFPSLRSYPSLILLRQSDSPARQCHYITLLNKPQVGPHFSGGEMASRVLYKPPILSPFSAPTLPVSLVVLGKVRRGLVAHLCPTLCNPMDYSVPGSSVHGIFQARMLEWVAISSSRASSRPRD